MKVLILYATVEGQTAKIAEYVAEHIKKSEHDVMLANIDDPTRIAFDGIDAVILAAPVHQQVHPRTFEAFLEASHDALAQRKTLLISVSLSAAFPEGLGEARRYITSLKTRTGFVPDVELTVAGAVRVGQYDYFATQFLQHVVLRGRDYDFSAGEHEFTDWEAVTGGVSDFLERN